MADQNSFSGLENTLQANPNKNVWFVSDLSYEKVDAGIKLRYTEETGGSYTSIDCIPFTSDGDSRRVGFMEMELEYNAPASRHKDECLNPFIFVS